MGECAVMRLSDFPHTRAYAGEEGHFDAFKAKGNPAEDWAAKADELIENELSRKGGRPPKRRKAVRRGR